jgi:hypothetical protein
LLLRILRRETMDAEGAGARKCIVYFATCAQVNYFYKASRRESLLASAGDK